MNFKIGDSVVYISHGGEQHNDAKLVIGKIYIISNIYEYNKNRFILLTEYRKQKINRLKNKIYEI